MLNVPRLIVSAARGGLGKTTFSLGIIAAWRKQGKRVAAFKKGPDFIDAGWLGRAAGTACYNLDLFMMDRDVILNSFLRHSAGADAAVVEGNRGLYDGVDESGSFSTAELAKLTQTPAVVIVDGTKASATVAAIVLGLRKYDEQVPLAGVILNNVSSSRHETVIRKAISRSSGVRVLGVVPRQRGGEFPERHMGLTPFHEHPETDHAIGSAQKLAEQYLDLNGLWDAATSAPALALTAAMQDAATSVKKVVIGVIRDKAFQFYYPDNIEALEQCGAVIREINAITDAALPADIHALYIGGGFPETQAAELAGNGSFCSSLRDAVEQGLPVYAECGGLIYLGRSLALEGRQYPMSGVLPLDFVLEKKPQAHGYAVLEGGETFFGKTIKVRGHEFHYSRAVNVDASADMEYRVERGSGLDGSRDGFRHRNVIAAYTHLHALATPEWAPAFVQKAEAFRDGEVRGE
jgi:cobyrinic acid a,c-diamide synthase